VGVTSRRKSGSANNTKIKTMILNYIKTSMKMLPENIAEINAMDEIDLIKDRSLAMVEYQIETLVQFYMEIQSKANKGYEHERTQEFLNQISDNL
jgi:hypothetical protein